MPSSLEDVLTALKPSYRSIDLRSVLVTLGDGQGWRAIWTILRFSSKSPEEITQEHAAIKERHSLNAQFCEARIDPINAMLPSAFAMTGLNVELSSYGVDEFPNIVSRLSQGYVMCKSRSIRVWIDAGIEVLTKPIWSRQDAYACDNQVWPVFYLGEGSVNFSLTGAANAQGKRREIRESDLDNWAREVNFMDFSTLCEHVLSVRRGQGNAFEIRAPIYARIDEVTASQDAIHTVGRAHNRLAGLHVECSILRSGKGSGLYDSAPTFVGIAAVETNDTGADIAQFSREFNLRDTPDSGLATVALFKVAPTRVDLGREQVLLRSGIPVFNTFTCFVPEADVEEYVKCLAAGTSVLNCRLYKQFKPRDSSKKVEELLEYVVNYVLALCQLSPLYLSNPQYDVLTGNLSAGSADILATTTYGDPLIVSCTMAMPDDKKRGMLLAVRTAIANRLKWEPDRIKTLLITGKPSAPSAGSEVNGFGISGLSFPSTNTEIKELGAENLREIWALIQHGDLYAAQQALGAR